MMGKKQNTGALRLRPDYEALNLPSAQIHFNGFTRTVGRSDGAFRSVFRGRSMELEDLREYVAGDNLRDIDWKSSSRTGEILVRNYVADKKRRFMFVVDTGKNMLGAMPDGHSKTAAGIITAASAAYMCTRAGAEYQILGSMEAGRQERYSCGAGFLEASLRRLEGCYNTSVKLAGRKKTALSDEFNMQLKRITQVPMRSVSLFLITDLYGVLTLDDRLIRSICSVRDLYVILMEDADWGSSHIYNAQTGVAVSEYLSYSSKMANEISNKKATLLARAMRNLRACGASYDIVKSTQDITESIIKVLNRGVS